MIAVALGAMGAVQVSLGSVICSKQRPLAMLPVSAAPRV